MKTKNILIIAVVALLWTGCAKEPEGDVTIIYSDNYTMPEKLKAVDEASGMSAQYIYPTTVYNHGILGDTIEAEGLRVTVDGRFHDFVLDSSFVFEDLRPRLVDLNNDGLPEIITILTNLTRGASVTIFEYTSEDLKVYATSGFIGTPYRWLNIAAIDDLDNDGEIEIAFVSTPHIGGYLHIGQIDGEAIYALTQQPGVSNHQAGSRNLCLSAVGVNNGIKTLYLPNNEFTAIIGFQWRNNILYVTDTIQFNVNPLVPLSEQYNFEGLQADDNCIYTE